MKDKAVTRLFPNALLYLRDRSPGWRYSEMDGHIKMKRPFILHFSTIYGPHGSQILGRSAGSIWVLPLGTNVWYHTSSLPWHEYTVACRNASKDLRRNAITSRKTWWPIMVIGGLSSMGLSVPYVVVAMIRIYKNDFLKTWWPPPLVMSLFKAFLWRTSSYHIWVPYDHQSPGLVRKIRSRHYHAWYLVSNALVNALWVWARFPEEASTLG
jgi:hypothetical protein